MDLVVFLVLGTQALHDGDRVRNGRFFDHYLLESSFERVVLFYEFRIFVQSRGTDDLELVLCK